MKKQAYKARRLVIAASVLALSAFAWGCSQTAPTGVDTNSIQQDQQVSTQNTQLPGWE
jgi:hypothetical protein